MSNSAISATPAAASEAAIAEPTPPLPDTSTRAPLQRPALALHAAHEAGAVELVAQQRAVGALEDRVAGAGDPARSASPRRPATGS